MFSPALETFRGNKIVMTVVLVLGAGLGFLLSPNQGSTKVDDWLPPLGALAFAVAILYWLSTVEISLHPEGIVVKSCFRSREMRWEDLDRVHYSVTRRSVNFIPVGTYCNYKLVDQHGTKISLSNRVERPQQLGTQLIQHSTGPLLQKAIDRYNRDEELSFGKFRLSRGNGIKRPGFFGGKFIPLNQIASYRIDHGQLYIFKVGEKRVYGTDLSATPNAFVFVALLDAIYRPEPKAPANA